jgi:hypothetical protein
MRFWSTVAQVTSNDLVAQPDVDAILADANGHGWETAINCLETYAERRRTWTDKQWKSYSSVVQRMLELLATPQVTTGQVTTTLPAGWRWTASYNTIVAEGKRLKPLIETKPPF